MIKAKVKERAPGEKLECSFAISIQAAVEDYDPNLASISMLTSQLPYTSTLSYPSLLLFLPDSGLLFAFPPSSPSLLGLRNLSNPLGPAHAAGRSSPSCSRVTLSSLDPSRSPTGLNFRHQGPGPARLSAKPIRSRHKATESRWFLKCFSSSARLLS